MVIAAAPQPNVSFGSQHVPIIEDSFEVPIKLGYVPNPIFTGREKDSDKLQRLVSTNKPHVRGVAVIVVVGTGGMGKTQLVLNYAFSHENDFSSICWINAQELQTIEDSFSTFAQQLLDQYARSRTPPQYLWIAQHLALTGLVDSDGRLTAKRGSSDQIVDSVKQWFRRPGNDKWLLIFDNVDDIESFNVSSFFPNASKGTIIITSRRPECVRYGHQLLLNEMEEGESIELLSKSSGMQINAEDGKCSLDT